jgi:hypothetical protein
MFEGNSDDLIFILTDEERKNYEYGKIDKNFLNEHVEDFNQKFYVCGPPSFVKDMKGYLKELGVVEKNLVYEGKNS